MKVSATNATRRRAFGWWLFALVCQFGTATAWAHEVRPAIVDLHVSSDGRYQLAIRLNLEAIIADIGPEHGDTAESVNADRYDALRALPPTRLRGAFDGVQARFLADIELRTGQQVRLRPGWVDLHVPPVGDPDLARDSVVTLAGQLPPNTRALVWQWAPRLGASIVRVTGPADEDLYRAYLAPGQASQAVLREGMAVQPLDELILDYMRIGFEHIVPKGLDHILFVVGLFLFSVHWRPLLWQVTSFTLAHSVTLALGVLGLVSISPAVVEPLIALSIIYVGVENLAARRLHVWRPMVIFGFGLLHGLGFAGVLEEVGLDRSHFVAGLLAFNLGIELGQLAVILGCFLLVGLWFRNKAWYRRRIVLPGSAVVAAVGGYWFIERTLL